MPKWKTPRNVKTIKTSLQEAIVQARFFQQLRITQDNSAYSQYEAGEITFDELSAYLTNRLRRAVGEFEKGTVRDLITKGTEKEQDVQDLYHWNLFSSGHFTIQQYRDYIEFRKTEEEEGSSDFLTLDTDLQSAEDTNRTNLRTHWANEFEHGQLSYNDYRSNLEGQLSFYETNSSTWADINRSLLEITPEYRLNELEQMYREGFWGTPTAEGGFDFSSNTLGYIAALQDYHGKLAEGSGEEVRVRDVITDAREVMRLHGISVDVAHSASNMNILYNQVTTAEGNYLKIRTDWQDGRATFEQVEAAWNAYQIKLGEYNTAFEAHQVLAASQTDVTRFPLPTVQPTPAPQTAPQIPTAPPAAPPEAPPQAPAPEPEPAPAPPTPTIPSGAIQLTDTSQLFKLGGDESKLYRQGSTIYLRPEFFRRISDPSELSQFTEEQIFRVGSSIYQII